jgi:uncharacterized small protein (DUF1192 family)
MNDFEQGMMYQQLSARIAALEEELERVNDSLQTTLKKINGEQDGRN